MADQQSQRPYRSSEAIARAGQAKPSSSSNDPLAELARLIGQSDPFGEFGRENARRAAAAQPVEAPAESSYAASAGQTVNDDYYAVPAPQPGAPYEPQDYGHQTYTQPGYGQPGVDGGDQPTLPYTAQPNPGYGHAEQYPAHPPYGPEDQDFYDDVPPSPRRTSIMVIAGVFALAIIGTAGAFGYRALFGSSGASSPPPVIKAETAPSKVVPPSSKDAQSNKLITDRVTGPQGEKLLSREETPVDRPAGVPDNSAPNTVTAAAGSGVVSAEPKKIRTIAIRPDGSANVADAAPAPTATAAANSAAPLALVPEQPTRQVQTQRIPATPPTQVAPPAQPAPEPAPRQPQQVRPPAPSNAPLSLNPNAPSAQPSAPARTAAVAPTQAAPRPSGGGSAYAVQVTSQRSEAEAEAAFRALQAKFGAQLGGKPHFIHKVDLGAKGTYYRALVGPFASGNEATELCSSLKAAGGQCLIQRN